MKQSDWSATNVVLGTKMEEAVDQTIFPLHVRKIGWAQDSAWQLDLRTDESFIVWVY